MKAEKRVIKYERKVMRLLLGKMVFSQQQEEQKENHKTKAFHSMLSPYVLLRKTMCQQRQNKVGN